MSNLAHRQQKIQEKRKQTPWREFVMEICSWFPLTLHRNNWVISRYPKTGREWNIIKLSEFNHENYISSDFSSNESFFEQYRHLLLSSQKPWITHFLNNENSDFVDMAYGTKNCYLWFSIWWWCENVLYSCCIATNITNCYNSFSITDNCDNIFSSKVVTGWFNIFYSFNIHNSSNIWFSSNLIGCSECLFCDNLENQSYCIKNIQYGKEEYLNVKLQYLSQKDQFDIYRSKITKKGTNYQSKHVNWNAIIFSETIENWEIVTRFRNARNIFYGVWSEQWSYNMYDGMDVGINSHDFYWVVWSWTDGDNFYCVQLWGLGSNLYYCIQTEMSSFCLGCIGLKNKSYCILNKQYSKEDRYEKVDEIFAKMDAEWTLGQFFPATMNPFYFNDTAAYLIDPTFTKEEVIAKGYLRRDEPIKVDIPEGAVVVKTSELDKYEGWVKKETKETKGENGTKPTFVSFETSWFLWNLSEYKWHIDPSILSVIIQDESGNVYKIVKMEYDFLIKHGLPLPRKHWLERMKENFRISS